VLQAFGSAVQGIGYAALRLKANTIWPLILIHALHDFTLPMGHLPIAMVEAPSDTIVAIHGLVLFARHSAQLLPELPPTREDGPAGANPPAPNPGLTDSAERLPRR
jgi:hypothetical protein